MKSELILSLASRPTPYAVLGQPIHHSFSPPMQQAAFDHLGVDARYFRIEVGEEGLARAVADLRAVPFGGWNCTVPNKVKMLDLCDELASSAKRLRSVNTVVNEEGVLTGHCTDGIGWSRALAETFGSGPDAFRILLLGAGGAGRAIATQALMENCPALTIANRNSARAEDLHRQLEEEFAGNGTVQTVKWSDVEETLQEVDVVVNATAAGLKEEEPAVLKAEWLRPDLRIFDTLYGAASEKLRKEVTAANAHWSDGLGMLLHQGAEAFSLWTGQPAPLPVMRQALENAFSASRR